jgi:glycosyltransferase involved in cell wall biosynthesis
MKHLKIDILCNDGSPLGVTPKTIYGDDRRVGVGGSELALLTLAEGLKDAGHEVCIYNDPWSLDSLDQRPIASFNPKGKRDILVIFRSPNVRSFDAVGKKIWWSCDQFTVGNFHDFGNTVDGIVTISEFHKKYFHDNYALESTVIDLPIREQDYQLDIPKVTNRLLFSSVPGRGLHVLADTYRAIKQRVPDVSLVITSDYRLWGSTPSNEDYRRRFLEMPGVSFLGAISRDRLIVEQYKAEILAYPCTYDELFCYSVAEAQYCGTLPVTSNMGAVETTNMGKTIHGNPDDPNWRVAFVDSICGYLENRPYLELAQDFVKERARQRFSMKEVLKQWDKVFKS